MKRRFVPAMHKNFSNGNGIFRHDSAPCHTSSKMRKEMEQLKINKPQWPGKQPDLNCIVNLGGTAKGKLGTM